MVTASHNAGARNGKGQFAKGPRQRKIRAGHKRCNGPCGKIKPYSAYHAMKPKTPHSDPVRPRCKECRKIDTTQDYIIRGDFVRQQQAAARHTMTEEQRQQERDRINNWQKSNPEKVKAYAKKYRQTASVSRYEDYQRRRALLANAPCDGHTMKELHAHWLHHGFDPNTCSYCDTPITAKTSIGDHVIPLSKAGDHMMDNLVPACLSCNSSKCDKLLHEEWTPLNMRHELTAA